MLVERNVKLPISRQEIWERIENMEMIIGCMPGVEGIKKLEDNKWHITMKQKVGFIVATFDAVMQITLWDPPNRMETHVDASARMGLGKAIQEQSVDFEQVSDNETMVKYRANIVMSGKMGSFGQRIISGKVDQLSTAFIENFLEKFS